MNRKEFIHKACLLTAGCLLPFHKVLGQPASPEGGLWPELVDYARWCPSPHNVQPWKLRIISATDAHLYYDPARVPGVVDEDTSFTIAGMSMFIECLNIAAQGKGFTVVALHDSESKLCAAPGAPRSFARLCLQPLEGAPAYDRELIKTRRTSRLHYNGKCIPEAALAQLQSVSAQHGYQLSATSDAALINDLVRLNADTVLQRADDGRTMAEMQQWMRPSEAEAAAKKDGLWSRANDTSPRLMRNFFFHHQRFDHGWKLSATRRLLRKSMSGTAQMAWIKGPFAQRNDWVTAGVMLQRLWLSMTQAGIYMHPIGTIITTPGAKAAFLQRIGADEQDGAVWLLVRIGYSRQPVRSYRLDAADIIIT